MAEIVWSDEAKSDLDEIFDYLVPRDRRAAAGYVDEIWLATSRLADFPELGRAYELGYRVLIVRNHLIFYRFDRAADLIRVAAIIDGRRDVPNILERLVLIR